ncbi:hypothetical protein [Streptomyces sp. NPDC002403]
MPEFTTILDARTSKHIGRKALTGRAGPPVVGGRPARSPALGRGRGLPSLDEELDRHHEHRGHT